MDNAARFGYKFEIIRGYTFEQQILFKEYVDTMYSIRTQYNKSHPMNLIAKLLMNSLYGKFGQRQESSIVETFNLSSDKGDAEFRTFLDTYYILREERVYKLYSI